MLNPILKSFKLSISVTEQTVNSLIWGGEKKLKTNIGTSSPIRHE